METSRLLVGALVASVIVAGCARSRPPVTEIELLHGPVTLEILNNNWADMAVYLLRSSHRMRLATVVTAQTAKVELPPDMIGPGGEIRIYAEAVAGHARYTSPRVYASPGSTVSLVLENNVRLSTLTAW